MVETAHLVEKAIYRVDDQGNYIPNFSGSGWGDTEEEAIKDARNCVVGMVIASRGLKDRRFHLSLENFGICNPSEVPDGDPLQIRIPGQDPLLVTRPSCKVLTQEIERITKGVS